MIRFAIAVALAAAPALASAQALDGTLKQISQKRAITVAYRTDALPFSFADQQGKPAGYTVELCQRVVAAIQQQLKLDRIEVNWMPATTQNRLDLVANGQAQMECGSTTATLSRMERVDFSTFTFVESGGLLVRKDAGIRSLSEVGGKRVAVIGGTTTEKAFAEAMTKHLISPVIVKVADRDAGLAALTGGKVDAFASDRLLLFGLAGKVQDPGQYTLLDEEFSFEPYAIVLPRGDPSFRLAVNRALSQIYRSGVIGEIFNRWFGRIGKPSGVLTAMFILGSIPE